MHAKKPVAYLKCPVCKASDFRHPPAPGCVVKENDYFCRACGFVLKLSSEKSWKSAGDKAQHHKRNPHKKHVLLVGVRPPREPHARHILHFGERGVLIEPTPFVEVSA
jgi:hypothetical protein